jgi:hypothetical protein
VAVRAAGDWEPVASGRALAEAAPVRAAAEEQVVRVLAVAERVRAAAEEQVVRVLAVAERARAAAEEQVLAQEELVAVPVGERELAVA